MKRFAIISIVALMVLSTIPYAIVVDDNLRTLSQIYEVLEEVGFRCLMAHSAEEAVSLLEIYWEKVTLLFTDVDMPGKMNGFDLACHVDEHWAGIEIVIASGRLKPQRNELPKGATFIAKPFSKSIVIQHLKVTLPDGKKPTPLRHPAM